MNLNLKFICGVLLFFTFMSCDSDDEADVNQTFEISINGKELFFDLSQEQFLAGFNVHSFNFKDQFVTDDESGSIYTLNSAGLASESMLFPDSTVQLSYFSLFSEDNGMDYEAGLLDMTMTVHEIDAYDQILDATFGGTFTDIMTDEEVTVSGEIKFGTN